MLNNKFTELFKLKRGVKQGGVLSGNLFNFYIDELIEKCCDANIGAYFNEINLCVIGFCDDLCLVGNSVVEVQSLLTICEHFTNQWGIDLNIEKCKYIVFGSKKFNNESLKLNNQIISITDNFKYLGLEFSSNVFIKYVFFFY